MRTCAPLGAAARFRSSAGIGSGTRHADRVSAPRAAARRVDDRRSQLEAAQILIAPPDTGERVGGLVVLDERVADAGLLPSGEDRLPRDAARAGGGPAVGPGAARAAAGAP